MPPDLNNESLNNKSQLNEKKVGGSFTCKTCNKYFAEKYSFKQPVLMHSNKKLFAWHMCDEAFNRKSY